MRLQQRNLISVWYALYRGTEMQYDEQGYENGQSKITYHAPVEMKCNVSPATGQSQIETFGNLDSYDKIIITDNMNCPIDENSVLFVDRVPDETGENYDYIVKRIAKSLNFIAYAVSKVQVKSG